MYELQEESELKTWYNGLATPVQQVLRDHWQHIKLLVLFWVQIRVTEITNEEQLDEATENELIEEAEWLVPSCFNETTDFSANDWEVEDYGTELNHKLVKEFSLTEFIKADLQLWYQCDTAGSLTIQWGFQPASYYSDNDTFHAYITPVIDVEEFEQTEDVYDALIELVTLLCDRRDIEATDVAEFFQNLKA